MISLFLYEESRNNSQKRKNKPTENKLIDTEKLGREAEVSEGDQGYRLSVIK